VVGVVVVVEIEVEVVVEVEVAREINMAIDFYFWANQKHRKLLAEALDDDKRAIKERAKLLSKKPPKPKKKQRQAAARQISYAAITHKLVSAPIIDEDDEHDPDALPKFIDLGVRIQLESGEWWFHHWRTGSWTHHSLAHPKHTTHSEWSLTLPIKW